MKFSLILSAEPPEQLIALTQAAEAAGFDAVTIPDSVCYPEEVNSKYPYNEDGSRDFLQGLPFIDPFILIAHLAAVTHRIRFTTAVYKLAIRQPVAVAKSLSSLAALCPGRIDFGVGISPWQEDFTALEVPWAKRGKRLDDMIEILRGLMTGDYFSFSSELIEIPSIKLCPVPSEPVPILIGGHAEPALKRAARVGDGWVGAGADLEALAKTINRLHELRCEYGREHLPFEIHTAGTADAFSAAGLDKFKAIGVDLMYLGFHDIYGGKPDSRSLEEKIQQIQWYGNEIINAWRVSQ